MVLSKICKRIQKVGFAAAAGAVPIATLFSPDTVGWPPATPDAASQVHGLRLRSTPEGPWIGDLRFNNVDEWVRHERLRMSHEHETSVGTSALALELGAELAKAEAQAELATERKGAGGRRLRRNIPNSAGSGMRQRRAPRGIVVCYDASSSVAGHRVSLEGARRARKASRAKRRRLLAGRASSYFKHVPDSSQKQSKCATSLDGGRC